MPRQPRHPIRTRAASTEDAILRSARRLLAKPGGAGLSMREVAGAAGITMGAIYRHFRDRDALLDRVVSDAFAGLELRLVRAMAGLPEGSFERVVALGAAYLAFAEDHREEFKLLFSPFRTDRRRLADMPGRAVYDLLRTAIVEAIAAGQLRPADPDAVALFLWSRVHGIIMLLWACDFSGALASPGILSSPQVVFELTRQQVAHGLLPQNLGPRT